MIWIGTTTTKCLNVSYVSKIMTKTGGNRISFAQIFIIAVGYVLKIWKILANVPSANKLLSLAWLILIIRFSKDFQTINKLRIFEVISWIDSTLINKTSPTTIKIINSIKSLILWDNITISLFLCTIAINLLITWMVQNLRHFILDTLRGNTLHNVHKSFKVGISNTLFIRLLSNSKFLSFLLISPLLYSDRNSNATTNTYTDS